MKKTERPQFAYPNMTDDGMELRDWFAGLAMQELIRRAETATDWVTVPADAYEMADLMMEARKEEGE